MRATDKPAAERPVIKLSTAVLLSDVASTGPMLFPSHDFTSATEVYVFPVPGGPWMSEMRCVSAWATASLCDALSSSTPQTRRRALPAGCALHCATYALFFSSAGVSTSWGRGAKSKASWMPGSAYVEFRAYSFTSTSFLTASSCRMSDVRLAILSILQLLEAERLTGLFVRRAHLVPVEYTSASTPSSTVAFWA
eukprot:gene10226-biopygen10231